MPLLIPRLDDGTVDLASDMALELIEVTAKVNEMPAGHNRSAEEIALVRVLGQVGWYEEWLRALAPEYVPGDFAPYHREFWYWVVRIGDTRPQPMIMCVPRGGAKTTSCQLALLWIACHGLRGYAIYVGEAQTAIEDKIAAVGELLVSGPVASVYPDVAQMYETSTGTKRDWRRSRIRTTSGFTLDAFGMDRALRGVKVEELRPGVIIIDDAEDYVDSPYMTQKRIDVLTRSIIPAAAPNAVIIYIQNKIFSDSIMAQLLDNRADFLGDRLTIGPVPQILDLDTETFENDEGRTQHRIKSGTPTWPEVLGIEVSNKQLEDEGLSAFLAERQHDTDMAEGDMFPRAMWRYEHETGLPPGLVLCRAWDLAATDGAGDWTVGVLMGWDKTNREFWVLDVVRGQWSTSKVEETILTTTEADAENYQRNRLRTAIESQPGAAGKAWNDRWVKEILLGHPVDLVVPQRNKAYRADGYSSAEQRSQIVLVKADWNQAFVREHAQFPDFGKHDDQVDAGSLAFNQLSKGRRYKGTISSAAGRTLPG